MNTYDYTDLPQKRDRVFMFAFSKEYFNQNKISFPKANILKKDMNMFVDFKKNTDNKYYLLNENKYYDMVSRLSDSKKRLYQIRKHELRRQAINVCPTLTANMGTGGHNVPFIMNGEKIRKLTERECLNLKGFPDNFTWPENISMGCKYEMIGNAVSPKISNIIAEELYNQLRGPLHE